MSAKNGQNAQTFRRNFGSFVNFMCLLALEHTTVPTVSVGLVVTPSMQFDGIVVKVKCKRGFV